MNGHWRNDASSSSLIFDWMGLMYCDVNICMNALAAWLETSVSARLSYSPGGKRMSAAFLIGKRMILRKIVSIMMAFDKRKLGESRRAVLKRLRREDLSSSSSCGAADLLLGDPSDPSRRLLVEAATSGALRRDAAPTLAEDLGIVWSIIICVADL